MMDALQLWETRKKTLHVFCGFFYDKLGDSINLFVSCILLWPVLLSTYCNILNDF
jgi:hypothetical protein